MQTDSAVYVDELESKIVDLSLQLKAEKNKTYTIQEENFERIRKVTHNLKNPIGVAFSFAEMLESTGGNSSNEKFDKYIEIIKNSTDFSIKLLNSLSQMNRLKSPNFQFNTAEVGYTLLLNNTLGKFNKTSENKQITVLKKIPENNIFLTVNENEIEIVIRVLIDNALRFSPNNSTIKVEVIEHEERIETIITDEGIGISESDLVNVFKEFYVVNTYSENKEKCIGLGLSIAKIIIENHKGTITVNSELNKGTCFKFSLPK